MIGDDEVGVRERKTVRGKRFRNLHHLSLSSFLSPSLVALNAVASSSSNSLVKLSVAWSREAMTTSLLIMTDFDSSMSRVLRRGRRPLACEGSMVYRRVLLTARAMYELASAPTLVAYTALLEFVTMEWMQGAALCGLAADRSPCSLLSSRFSPNTVPIGSRLVAVGLFLPTVSSRY